MTLGRLWARQGVFAIQAVVCQSMASATRAAQFIGAGDPSSGLEALQPAAVVLIATPDDAISSTCLALATRGLFAARPVVWHCSGALGSEVLETARAVGAAVGSAHPLASFADPADIATYFAGTFCALEGDARAKTLLGEAFRAIGARTVEIEGQRKILYHAGAVLASNATVALIEAAMQALEQADIDRPTALAMLSPLVKHTVDNVFRQGPRSALTGPVARGDLDLVRRQHAALAAADAGLAEVYRLLSRRLALLAGRPDPLP